MSTSVGDVGTGTGAGSLPVARDLGQTHIVAEASALAALIAAEDGARESAAALSSAARRHLDNVGIVGQRLTNVCWEKAEALIATSPQDFSAARARGALMTVEELVNAALAALDHRALMTVYGKS